ncbi:MAG: Response regulator receiver domain [Pseudomonadota bacterium]|jgi:DNA-binding response OmpR family regulator
MAAAESMKSDHESHQESPVTLLLIEDVSVTAEIERSYFASVGFNVIAASSVVDSESHIAREWVDIVIVDAGFARQKGIDLIPILRKSSKNKEVKVIVTSVSGDIQLKKSATTNGASAFIVKPAPRPRYLKEIKKLSAQKTRDTERVHQSLEVELNDGKSSVRAKTLDLSSEGIHLAMDNPRSVLELGAVLQMSFTVEGKMVKVQGQVVRHTPKGVGIRFVSIGAQAQRLLDKFLLRYSLEQQSSHFYL